MAARIGGLNALKESFCAINTPEFFGFIRNDIAGKINLNRIMEDGKKYLPRSGWRDGETFIKKLDGEEITQIPNERFQNSALLWRADAYPKIPRGVVIPRGILYVGRPTDLINNTAEAYFLSDIVEGRRLFDVWEGLDDKQRIGGIRQIAQPLKRMASKGFYIMDFAPRDVVIPERGCLPVIVDTEHVLYDSIAYARGELKTRQREQFREDYQNFFDANKLNDAEKIIFD